MLVLYKRDSKLLKYTRQPLADLPSEKEVMNVQLTPARFLASIQSDSAALAKAASEGLDAPVPSCPGWTVRDLVLHTGRVHRGKEKVVRERLQHDDLEFEEPSEGLLDWFRKGAELLINTLRSVGPDEPVWSWHPPDQTAAFWYRRIAHETLIHRVDAELAHGSVSGIDPEIAEDGIDEGLKVFIEGYPPWALVTRGNGLIRMTTGLRHWSLQMASFSGTTRSGRVLENIPTVLLTGDAGRWDSEIKGDPVALNLWLWGRAPLNRLKLNGDRSLAARLREIAAAST